MVRFWIGYFFSIIILFMLIISIMKDPSNGQNSYTTIPDLDLKLITHALLLSLIGSVTIVFPMITRKIILKINRFNQA